MVLLVGPLLIGPLLLFVLLLSVCVPFYFWAVSVLSGSLLVVPLSGCWSSLLCSGALGVWAFSVLAGGSVYSYCALVFALVAPCSVVFFLSCGFDLDCQLWFL